MLVIGFILGGIGIAQSIAMIVVMIKFSYIFK